MLNNLQITPEFIQACEFESPTSRPVVLCILNDYPNIYLLIENASTQLIDDKIPALMIRQCAREHNNFLYYKLTICLASSSSLPCQLYSKSFLTLKAIQYSGTSLVKHQQQPTVVFNQQSFFPPLVTKNEVKVTTFLPLFVRVPVCLYR